MQPRPSPTSPAVKVKSATPDVASVWQQGNLQQPLRTPWGKILSFMLLVAIVISGLIFYGLGWLAHRYPNSWLTRLAPLTTSTTTVIQQTKELATGAVPATVQAFQNSAYGVARNQGEQGIYAASDISGPAWPLSSSGWLLSMTGAWPVDVKSLVLIPAVGQPLNVTATLRDPASPFVFLKTTDVTAQPSALAPADGLRSGARVWVVAPSSVVQRQLMSVVQPKWTSSDAFEQTWSLDATVTLPIGSAVVDSDGRIVGLLGSDSRVWPVTAVDSVLKQVIQTGKIVRPTLGLHFLDQTQATITGQPNATGLLIGADEGQAALVVKGPAEKAGIKAADVVTALNNQRITSSLPALLQTFQPGDTISLTLMRNSKELKVDVKLGSIGS